MPITACPPKRRRAICAMLAIVLVVLANPAINTLADGVVHFYYFTDPDCLACAATQRDVLDPLLDEYGNRLVLTEIDITDHDNMSLMIALEEHLHAGYSSIPEVIIGDEVLAGPEEIAARFAELVERHLARGGVELPTAGAIDVASTETASPPAPTKDSATPSTQPVVEAVFFWSETCTHCHLVIEQTLSPLAEQYGDQILIYGVDISYPEGREMWNEAIDAAELPNEMRGVPMLFIGSRVLVGSQQIPQLLPGLVEQHLAEGGVGYPDFAAAKLSTSPTFTPAPTATAPSDETPSAEGPEAPPAVHAAYFYQPGCDSCDRAEHDLAYMMIKYPQFVVQRFNVKEEVTLNQYLCDRVGVPEQRHLTAPALFLGDDYLVGDDIRAGNIERLLNPYLKTGAAEPWEGWEASAEAAEESILERFRSFGVLTVVGAGLLDGVNPCAFATMIFLISYLSLRKRRGRELLFTGGAFTAGVFLTYLGVGFGLLKFLSALPFLHIIGKWLYSLTALLCLGLAVGSYLDYRKAKAGRLEDMSLKLPDRMRGWTKTLIREGVGAKRFVLSAFILGLGVSIVELACTGQVYLPTIVFVLGMPQWRTQASLLLVLYNIMFVLPLVGVFVLAYYGTTSQQLIEWMTAHAAKVKIGMAALFLLLAAWLAYSVIWL